MIGIKSNDVYKAYTFLYESLFEIQIDIKVNGGQDFASDNYYKEF